MTSQKYSKSRTQPDQDISAKSGDKNIRFLATSLVGSNFSFSQFLFLAS